MNPNAAVSFMQKTWEVARSERLHLKLYGDETTRDSYRRFTAPHRLIPLFGRKTFGVALAKLPDRFEDYLRGKSFEQVRRKRRRAIRAGFRFGSFHAPDRVSEILEINRSAPSRQGRPIPAAYLDEAKVHEFCRRAGTLDGIFDAEDRLWAYAFTPILGDIFLFARLLGFASANNYGVMDLLVTESIRQKIEYRAEHGYPHWAMYDTFWGASPGLRQFKRALGFQPYRVKWSWVPTDAQSKNTDRT